MFIVTDKRGHTGYYAGTHVELERGAGCSDEDYRGPDYMTVWSDIWSNSARDIPEGSRLEMMNTPVYVETL